MSDYINRQEIVDYIKQNGLVYATTLETWPAADVREVARGEWIPKKIMTRTPSAKNYYCSVCKEEGGYTNFCPNCGADMRGNHQ